MLPNPVLFFGVNTPIYTRRGWRSCPTRHTASAASSEYVYDYVTYGHLGGYRCPNCGYCRPSARRLRGEGRSRLGRRALRQS